MYRYNMWHKKCQNDRVNSGHLIFLSWDDLWMETVPNTFSTVQNLPNMVKSFSCFLSSNTQISLVFGGIHQLKRKTIVKQLFQVNV